MEGYSLSPGLLVHVVTPVVAMDGVIKFDVGMGGTIILNEGMGGIIMPLDI